MTQTLNCLLIGFYDRHNIGDDTYKHVLPKLLPCYNITTISCDDAHKIDDNVDIVLIGGGDLVNDYFMNKVQQLLKLFTGRVYGVSLGIPFKSCSHYLHIFDHVFVRSKFDYGIAVKEIGERNVSYLPDFSVALGALGENRIIEVPTKKPNVNVGVCLAQPLFYNNPKKTSLLDGFCHALKVFADTVVPHVRFILLAFNSNTKNNQECDYVINNHIAKLLRKRGLDVILSHNIPTPSSMLSFFQTQLDMCICMRYHSVMFSLISNIPFVPVYVSQKVHNVLEDFEFDHEIAYRLPYDAKYRPIAIDAERMTSCLHKAWDDTLPRKAFDCCALISQVQQQLNDTLCLRQPYASIISRIEASQFTDVMNRCKLAMCKYLNIEPHNFQDVLHNVGSLHHDVKSPMDIARFLCYNITGQMHHPCVWGLAENLQKTNFKLYDALKYIFDDTEMTNKTRGSMYCPTINNFTRNILINVDFIFSNDFTKYHRSGWSYVVGGLMNLDATTMLKQSDIFVDTYVDRSFHWGKDIMKTLGEIPYTKTWYGFIHHTFDTSHSFSNCQTLFEQNDFITSLQTCKGLFALTKYLKDKIDIALCEKGISHVPVYVLYHPMEFVENNFTMEKFNANDKKKIVQIGAWLRNPYAIYQMTLPPSGDFDIMKVHLKGTEMDLYFAPPNFLDVVAQALCDNEGLHSLPSSSICRGEYMTCNQSQYPSNKYYQGVLQLLTSNHNSVQIIDKLSNVDYDKLLAENIVFLNLVDCSAVNTVIECIVRDTPLIVNRHPALEELLGEDYPGFYTTLQEASVLTVSLVAIERMHNHMKTLDKSKYMLDNFVKDFQQILVEGKCSQTYNVKKIKQNNFTQNNILPMRQFKHIYRFLPWRYRNALEL
jgi:hypothetical protein